MWFVNLNENDFWDIFFLLSVGIPCPSQKLFQKLFQNLVPKTFSKTFLKKISDLHTPQGNTERAPLKNISKKNCLKTFPKILSQKLLRTSCSPRTHWARPSQSRGSCARKREPDWTLSCSDFDRRLRRGGSREPRWSSSLSLSSFD